MGQGNYSDAINTAVQGANLPKSALSQEMSQYLGAGNNGGFNSILNALGQIGNYNAFPGIQAGQSTPGAQLGQAPLPNSSIAQDIVPQIGAGGPSNAGGAGPTSSAQGTTANDAGTPSSGLGNTIGGPQIQSPSFNLISPMSMPSGGVPQQQQSQQQQFLPDANINPNFNILQPQQGGRPSPAPGAIPPAISNVPGMQSQLLPQVQQANPSLNGINTQGMDQQAYSTLLNQLQAPGVSNYNPSAQLLQSPAVNQQFQQMQGLGIQGLAGALNNQLGAQSQPYTPQQVSLNPLQGNGGVNNLPQAQQQFNPATDPYYQAVQQSLQNQQLLDQKNLQAQFSASGGTGRGTPAAFAQAQLMAQQSPQMAAALGQVAQQEQANQLQAVGLNQQGLLQNQNLQNQFGLAQQGNQLNAQQLNQQAGLQAAGLGNQQLGTLGGLLNNNQQLQLQNYLSTIGANQSQLGLASQLANQAGNMNLSQGQLGSQNIFNAAQLNSQNANNALQNQLGFQTNQNQALLGQNNLLSQLGQFNAQQGNQFNQNILQQQQTANQSQINNQLTALQNLAQIAAQFGLSGIPGGSANVNLGAQSQNTLQQLGGIL